MTGHTPGPWMAASGPSSIVGWPIVGPGGRAIASLTWWPRQHYQPDVSDEAYDALTAETAANARLIAASPELLAALQAAMEVFGELTNGKPGESVLPVYSRLLSVGAQGRAAISLATQTKGNYIFDSPRYPG